MRTTTTTASMNAARLPLMAAVLALTMTTVSSAFNLTIMHTNDVHCRFEEANKYGGSCTPDESAKGQCYGGYARLVTASRLLRQQNPNSIFLNGGDFFQGTM